MDRQIVFAVAIAIGSMLGFSGFFFSSAPSDRDAPRTYAPDDIRNKYQQADAKKPKRKKTATANAPQLSKSGKPSPTTILSTGGSRDDSGGDTADESNEEPSVSDHPPQEEPELD